jgi:hypothetical protein
MRRTVVLASMAWCVLTACGESRQAAKLPAARAGRAGGTSGGVGDGFEIGGRGGSVAGSPQGMGGAGGPTAGAAAVGGAKGSFGGTAGSSAGGAPVAGTSNVAGSESAGSDGEGGAPGSVECGFQSPLDTAQATGLATQTILTANPDLARDTTFAVTELPVAGSWEALNVQLFHVSFVGADSQPFREEFYARHGSDFELLVSNGGAYGLSSATVSDDALYYSYAFGSGVLRSHVGRLRLRDCVLERVESGGYAPGGGPPLLFVKPSGNVTRGGAVVAEAGVYDAFNSWHAEVWFGTVLATETSLGLVDADDQVIEPNFPER